MENIKEMRINKTPVRTSENYGMNDLKYELDEDFKNKISEFKNTNVQIEDIDKNKVIIEKSEFKDQNEILNSRIGIDFEKYQKINITINKNLGSPIIIDNKFDDKNSYLVENMKIYLKQDVKAKIIINYFGKSTNEILNYLKQQIILEKDAEAKIILINFLPENAKDFLNIENELQEKSKLDYIIIDLGAKNKITNYYSKQVGNESKQNVYLSYLGKDEDLIDLNYLFDIYGKETKINFKTEGALKDKAKKHYKGTIDFKEGSSKSAGKEYENCLMLSKDASSRSLPMLLCHEEDVEGEHGVGTGKLDNSKLFYLMSRGFNIKQATILMIKANFNKIISKINDEEIEKNISDKIDEILK